MISKYTVYLGVLSQPIDASFVTLSRKPKVTNDEPTNQASHSLGCIGRSIN